MKITEYNELAETPNDNDFLVMVDVSDTSMSASGTTKKVKKSNLGGGGLANVVEDLTPQLGGDLDLNTHGFTAVGPTTITSTEVSYLDGVSSNIQTQLNNKQASGATLTSLEGLTLGAGDMLYATGADTLTDLAIGSPNQELRVNAGGTAPEWYTPSVSGGQTVYDAIVAPSGGDYTTLGAAITASSSGWSIFVRGGTYTESAITTANTNLTIIGESPETVTLSGSTNDLSFSGAGVQIINCGFAYTTGRLTLGGARAKLINCKVAFTGSPASTAGVRMTGTDSLIDGLQYSTTSTASTATTAVQMTNDRSKIVNSTIVCNTVSASARAIDMQGTYSVVANNTISPLTGAIGGGMVIKLGTNNVCDGNICASFTSDQGGAMINGGNFNTISNNTLFSGKLGINAISNSSITGNTLEQVQGNGGVAIKVSGSYSTYSGNALTLGAGSVVGFEVQGSCLGNIISANNLYGFTTGVSVTASTCTDTTITSNKFLANTTPISDSGIGTIIMDNSPVSPNFEKQMRYMKNTSGSTINAGDVVTYKSVANGDEVTTTTTAGDDKVYGVATASILNNAYGTIQVLGKTTILKVNGTTDIAIGDFLTTFTTAGIASKATAGDMVFAIAQEAYIADDSNGIIDALIISPRLI